MSGADSPSASLGQVIRLIGGESSPDPSADATWWKVPLQGGRRMGWVRVSASVPAPTDQWIGEELERQARRFGGKLDGRLLAPGGLDLTLAAMAAPQPGVPRTGRFRRH